MCKVYYQNFEKAEEHPEALLSLACLRNMAVQNFTTNAFKCVSWNLQRAFENSCARRISDAGPTPKESWRRMISWKPWIVLQRRCLIKKPTWKSSTSYLVGGWGAPLWKILYIIKIGSSSRIFGVNIQNKIELPPPSEIIKQNRVKVSHPPIPTRCRCAEWSPMANVPVRDGGYDFPGSCNANPLGKTVANAGFLEIP